METKAIDNIEAEVSGLKKEEDRQKGRGYRAYKHVVDFGSDFCDGMPFSAVMLRDGKIGAMTREDDFIEIRRVDTSNSEQINGMWYFEWEMLHHVNRQVGVNEIWKNLLFLPKLDDNGRWNSSGGWYTVVDDGWKEIKQNGDFDLPEVIPIVAV